MANLIKLRKGLDINLKGKAAAEVVCNSEGGCEGTGICNGRRTLVYRQEPS